MDVQDVMSTHIHLVGHDADTASAARRMEAGDIGALVVMDSDSVVGVVTDRDLAIRCLGQGHVSSDCTVALHMSSPPITVAPTVDMLEAAHLMTDKKITRLPVVDDDKLVGFVSLSDIALAMDIALTSMNQALHDLLRGMGAARSA